MKVSDALATLALLVAVASGAFSYIQTMDAREQLRLARLQIRPYVKEIIDYQIHPGNHLGISIVHESLSAVPAYIVYSQERAWVDGATTGAFVFNRAGDFLYEHRNSRTQFPGIPHQVEVAALQDKATVMIGGCLIYGSIDPSDDRRWEFRELNRFNPRFALPVTEYTRESQVPAAKIRCDTSKIVSEWQATRPNPTPVPD